jgi:hypothetical protein
LTNHESAAGEGFGVRLAAVATRLEAEVERLNKLPEHVDAEILDLKTETAARLTELSAALAAEIRAEQAARESAIAVLEHDVEERAAAEQQARSAAITETRSEYVTRLVAEAELRERGDLALSSAVNEHGATLDRERAERSEAISNLHHEVTAADASLAHHGRKLLLFSLAIATLSIGALAVAVIALL